MATTLCSECDEEITIAGRIRLGAKLICDHCGARLEVVSTMPLEVDLLQEEEEEDDDLWDDDELEDDLDDDDDGDVLAGFGAAYDDLDEEELDDTFEEDLDDLEEDDDESFDDDRRS